MTKARNFVLRTEAELLSYFDFDACFASAHDFLLTYFQLLHFYYRDHPLLAYESPLYELPSDNNSGSLDSLKICAIKFAKASAVMSLAVCDYRVLKFNNSVLAAAIFYQTYEKFFETNAEAFKKITGYASSKLKDSIDFVQDFPSQDSVDLSKEFPDYGEEDQEIFSIVFHQSHTSLKTLEDAVFIFILRFAFFLINHRQEGEWLEYDDGGI
jgi:hypothetical protein